MMLPHCSPSLYPTLASSPAGMLQVPDLHLRKILVWCFLYEHRQLSIGVSLTRSPDSQSNNISSRILYALQFPQGHFQELF